MSDRKILAYRKKETPPKPEPRGNGATGRDSIRNKPAHDEWIDEEAEEAARRNKTNLISVGVILLLIGIIYITIKLLSNEQTLENCFASGRRDCVEIPTPPR